MQQIVSVPFYLNWTFWAAFVAALALILSQLPPISQLIRRSKLTMELHSRISLSHKIGNPNMHSFIILTNIGGRSIRIKEIVVRLQRDKKDPISLSAQGYLQEPNDKNTILFTGFQLKNKEEWAHEIDFFNYVTRSEEKLFRVAVLELRNDIIEKRKLPENKEKLIEADPKFVSPLIDFFNRKFIWNPGEYKMEVVAHSSKGNIVAKQDYRFTVFESDSSDLSKVQTAYKYGDGIYWDSGDYPGIIVQINES